MSLATLLIIIFMVGANALFAAYEIALASIGVARLKALSDEHRRGAKAAWSMKQNMEASLAVVQLGITLVGAIAAATGGAGAEESLSPWLLANLDVSTWVADALALALVVVPLSAMTIVVGELLPKVFALKNKEWVCLKLSPFMKLLSFVVYPAVWFLEGIVSALIAWGEQKWTPRLEGQKAEVAEMQELRAVVALARTSRLIGGKEEQIILGAARLSARTLDEIMIPIEEVVTLDLQHTMAESLAIAHTDMHTRFPICEQPGDLQTICGYVNFKDIVSELRLSPDQPSLRGIMRAIPNLDAKLTIAVSLERLIREHVHIALVRSAEKRLVGMITLEDILEELVGDILDEYDRAPTHISPGGFGWIMGGGVLLEKLEEVTGFKVDRESLPRECRTLQDWIHALLARPAKGGDVLRSSGLRILVRKIRRQQILEALVTQDPLLNRPVESGAMTSKPGISASPKSPFQEMNPPSSSPSNPTP